MQEVETKMYNLLKRDRQRYKVVERVEINMLDHKSSLAGEKFEPSNKVVRDNCNSAKNVDEQLIIIAHHCSFW